MKKYLKNLLFSASIVIIYFNNSCKRYEDSDVLDVNSKDTITQNNSLNIDNEGFNYYPSSSENEIIMHNNYTLSYVEKYEQAEWVAYELKKSDLNYNNNNFERPFFIEDPQVESGSADWRNYRKSGYDKGHLCPAGDRKFSKIAFDETFYTSNISPQKHDFNEGVWNRLEQKVRYWAGKYDGIYVVTGGVFTDNMKTIGSEDVAVPNYFYKVLLDTSRDEIKMIAFLVPHEDSDLPLYEFVVSVDELEKRTGIDFFPKLEDAIENRLEQNANYKSWSF
jgi:endonuclease G, mitochondrial